MDPIDSSATTTPSEAAQEEYFGLMDVLAPASMATAGLRTVCLYPEECDDFFAGVEGSVFEHLTVAVMTSEAEEQDGCCQSMLYAPDLLERVGLDDDDERMAHNERALAIARHIDAEAKMAAFLARSENRGKRFKLFRSERLEGLLDDTIEPLQFPSDEPR